MGAEISSTSVPCDVSSVEERRALLEAFYLAYASKLGRRLRGAFPRHLRSTEDVEDAVQTTFLQMLRAPSIATDRMIGWAWAIGKNVVRQGVRANRAGKRAFEVQYYDLDSLIDRDELVDTTFFLHAEAQMPAVFKDALASLAPRQRELMTMWWEDVPREEMKRRMGITNGSFAVLLSIAKHRLREAVLAELERARR